MKLPGAKTTLCYEDELLICCARVSPSAQAYERLEQLLHEPIDWQTVLNRSWWHRLRPLTYRHLRNQSTGLVPAAVLKALGESARELEERNERLMTMLVHVAELFETASLPMLVFKGPTLASDAYGDLGLRECGDLDMLIRPEDFSQVKALLTANGFECLWDQIDNERKRQLFACEFKRDGVELDVHWDLAPGWHNYQVDFDSFWDSGEPLTSNSCDVKKLCAEDSLAVLCMHGARHWWERLRWICDIAETVNAGLITDWQRVQDGAGEARCQRSVWLGLRLAGDLLDAKIPAEVKVEIDRSAVVQRLAQQVGVWLENAERAHEVRKLPDRFLFRMRLCERWRDRLPQLAHYLVSMPSRSLNWNP